MAASEPATREPGPADRTAELDLQAFFPYRLAVLAEAVSRAVAQIYLDRFDLSRQEWRVLAALANNRRMAAKEIADYSALDKMQVSRAVAELAEKGYLARAEEHSDRRHKPLRLTAAGLGLYRKIAPLALAREDYLMAALTPAERDVFDRAIDKLRARADGLTRRG